MKILKIRFQNLNSLVGEWSVDFTLPAYAAEGIFAITGPTGAGKSTILDAICLALFSQTPRLGKVSKGGNEIMSRQTGECFAEVTFQTRKGTYKCHWSQRRARKRPSGELQPPRHEISDAVTGKPLEVGARSVADKVAEVAGMDFERFTRSMLLAQGGFAAFLQSDANGRSPILEQITGTEIYSQISVAIHERQKAERQRLDDLERLCSGMQPLGEADEQALRDRHGERRKAEQSLEEKLAVLRQDIAWVEQVRALENGLRALTENRSAHMARKESFRSDRDRLDRARRALPLAAPSAALEALEKEQARERADLKQARVEIPELATAVTEARQAEMEAGKHQEDARRAREKEIPAGQKTRELDIQILERTRQLAVAENDARRMGNERAEWETQHNKVQREQQAAAAEQKRLAESLAARATDAGLVESLKAIRLLFANLAEREENQRDALLRLGKARELRNSADADLVRSQADRQHLLSRKQEAEDTLRQLEDRIRERLAERDSGDWQRELNDARDRLRFLTEATDAVNQVEGLRRRLEKAEQLRMEREAALAARRSELDAASLALGKARENEALRETNLALRTRLRSFEEERARLSDGAPCPLCGAIEHPYAKGNVPIPDESETDLRQARADRQAIEEKYSALREEQARIGESLQQVGQEIEERQSDLVRVEQRCREHLDTHRLAWPDAADPDAFRAESETARQAVETASRVLQETAGLEKERQEALQLLEDTRRQAEEVERTTVLHANRAETAARDEERLDQECGAAALSVSNARQAALRESGRFGVTDLPPGQSTEILRQLEDRRNFWQDLDRRHAAQVKAEELLTEELRRQANRGAQLEREEGEKQARRDELAGEAETLRSQRREMYGDRDPDAEERRLSAAVEDAERARERARQARELAERALDSRQQAAESLARSLESRAGQIDDHRERLQTRCREAGFSGEEDFRSAFLSQEEHKELQTRQEEIDQEGFQIETRLQDKSEALAAERGKARTTNTSEELEHDLATAETALREAREEAGQLGLQLAANASLREQVKETQSAVEAQRREWTRWNRLHDLIGSADGKKFRNFAQGLTFEILVSHANSQLRKLSDRYLLVQRKEDPLELNVVDSYQAGEIRSTRNLSGGESFLVSLALALGLSGMASRHVPVDSLFLDEGFGTLDEDALETALETLAELRQENKLIGVISHVGALKERIATRVQVTPRRGGRSVLDGPGCSGPLGPVA